MDTGDIVILRHDETISILKILRIDPHPFGDTFHCLNYWSLAHDPTEDEIENLEVECYHSPINGDSIRRAGKVLCNRPVSEAELVGFIEYLKRTDFARYAKETKQDVTEIARKANAHYERANELANDQMFKEAIDEYTLAIEEFPLLYEAVDNRGSTYMDLGDLRAAISDFEWSIELNPESNFAYISKAKCHLRLGELDEVEKTLLEGVRRCPQHQETFLRLLELAKSEKQQVNAVAEATPPEDRSPDTKLTKKPRWKFWA